jgi:glycerol-3-phosphate dehydrogenase
MQVAVIGGGVVGAAVALALARRGVGVTILEAEPELALAASGTNSGILHTGFDSTPGELETAMILRAAALRPAVMEALGVPVLRCGAAMRDAPAHVVATAAANGVAHAVGEDGTLEVPGEWVTDPVAYTLALADAAVRHGAELRLGERFEHRAQVAADVYVNCAGLHADAVARSFGDASFAIYPRKGEFFVFDVPLEGILLPAPTSSTKGVLVFPTLDGRCVAGPTAVDLEDKDDWSVRAEARDEVLAKAVAMHPPLEGAEPVGAYAGLRPAGRGVNYVVGRSAAAPELVNVAAIRSTGLTASLGLAEHVAGLVAPGAPEAPLLAPGAPPPAAERPWWQRTAAYRA